MGATEARARLQTALQGLWGGKIILRAIIWWVTIISSLLSSTFSRLCCSWLPALHLLHAESSWETKQNPCGLSHGIARAGDGSVLFLFALHQQLALVVATSVAQHQPHTHYSTQHSLVGTPCSCHHSSVSPGCALGSTGLRAPGVGISSWCSDSTGLFDQILVRLPLRKQINMMPQMLLVLVDGKLTCGLSFRYDIPCWRFRWQRLLLVCKYGDDFLVFVPPKSFWFAYVNIST